MSQDILFDNLLVTDDYVVAEQWTSLTFELKRKQIDKEAVSKLFQYTIQSEKIKIRLPQKRNLLECEQ